jgi:hypothetical protein
MKVDITSGTLSAALISASALVAWAPTRGESHGTGSSNGPAIEGAAAAPRGHGREATIMPVVPVPADLAVTSSRRTSNREATWRQR